MLAVSVFISYAENDRARAESLHADLHRSGAEVFQFSMSATLGTPSWTEILKQISAADIFVLLVSEQSNNSKPVQAELEHAYGSRLNLGRPERIIPLLLEEGIRPTTLATAFNWLEFTDYEAGLDRLLGQLGLERPVESRDFAKRRRTREAFEAGLRALASEHWEEAADWFRHVIEADSTNSGAHNNLGIALRELGKMDEAIAEHRRATELDPDNVSALNNLGTALWLEGRPDEGLSAVRRAAELSAADVSIRCNLAVILADMGDFHGAERQATVAVELDPARVIAWRELASALHSLGRFDAALDTLVQAERRHPHNADLVNLRAMCQAALGDAESSERSLREALEIEPDSASIIYNVGVALSLQGRYEEALQQIERAFEAGFSNFELTETHDFLTSLRGHPTYGPRLRELLAGYKERTR